jgi:glycosyltransferase involved in cell wall biosynthesis
MIITIPSFGFGSTGGDRVVTSLANNLVKRGHKVNIINLYWKPVHFSLSSKVNLVNLPFKRGKDYFDFVLRGINTLASNLPESDIFLANWVYTVIPCIANNNKGKTIFMSQANDAYKFGNKKLKILQGIALGTYKLNIPIIAPSSHIRRFIKEKFGNTATIISSFVNLNIFKLDRRKKKKKSDKIKLLFVGNVLDKNKGFAILQKVFDRIKNDNIELHIASQEDGFKFNQSRIIFHKPKNDRELAVIYKNCDIFFNLSREEGFGLTLLEAMACGLVCVGSDSGGIMDFAKNKHNCFIVERKVNSVLSATRDIIKNLDKYRDRMIKNAIKTADGYSEKKMIDSYENFLKRL